MTPSASGTNASLKFVPSYKNWGDLSLNLGNYFTRGYLGRADSYHKEYTYSSLVVLPYFHDSRGDFEGCLLQTALKHKQAVSPKMTLWNRLRWDKSSEGVLRYKQKFKVHYGPASFGVCNPSQETVGGSWRQHLGLLENMRTTEQSRCGHVLIMQNPVSWAISDLVDCLLDPNLSSLCYLVHQKKVAVEEWVTSRGSVVFRNLLFSYDISRNKTFYHKKLRQTSSRKLSSDTKNISPEADTKNISPGIDTKNMSPEELCEREHRKFVDNLTPDVVERLVNFITKNLQTMFSVVGTFEDIENSLTMLNYVFRFPVHECEFLSRFGATPPHRKSRYPQKTRHSKKTRHQQQQEYSVNSTKQSLFTNSESTNMASLSGIFSEATDDLSRLEAYRHIEHGLVWESEVRAQTVSTPSIDDREETLDNFIGGRGTDTSSNNQSKQHFTDLKQTVENKTRTVSEGAQTNKHVLDKSADRSLHGGSKLRNTNNEDDHNFLEDNVYKNIVFKVSHHPIDAVRARLYEKFLNNDVIKQSLAADMRIYEAVRKLYLSQKRLFFNSL